MIIILPTPPPLNNLFINIRKGRARAPAYQDWLTEAGYLMNTQHPGRFSTPVSVSLEAEENPRRDLDGYWKPILDLLVTHRVIPNDNCKVVRELRASWSKKEGCMVTVMPWVEYGS